MVTEANVLHVLPPRDPTLRRYPCSERRDGSRRLATRGGLRMRKTAPSEIEESRERLSGTDGQSYRRPRPQHRDAPECLPRAREKISRRPVGGECREPGLRHSDVSVPSAVAAAASPHVCAGAVKGGSHRGRRLVRWMPISSSEKPMHHQRQISLSSIGRRRQRVSRSSGRSCARRWSLFVMTLCPGRDSRPTDQRRPRHRR